MRMRHHFCRAAAVLLAAVALPTLSASATTLFLSEFSSDETPASDLTALLEFMVSGSTMTLTVTNQTHTTTSGYNMNELYFNTSEDITSLTLTGASGSQDGDNFSMWTLLAATNGKGGPTMADGFGKFDWAVKDGVDSDPSTIHPMEVQTFDFSFTCAVSAICDDADFGLEFSTTKAAMGNVRGAAMFVVGPGDDSAFGGTTIIPEPSSAALLGLGLAGLALRRRRAH